MTNVVIYFLNVTFFMRYITCPSSSPHERIRLLSRLSKLIVQNYESEVVHVYKNVGLYSIKRPRWVRKSAPYLSWFTIRVRKSSDETFRTLVDICGLEVQLLLFTEKIVKMQVKEKYEYTLTFEGVEMAENFANVIYYSVPKDQKREQIYRLDDVTLVRNGDGSDVMESPAMLAQKRVSARLIVYYVKSSAKELKMVFSSRHFRINSVNRPYVFTMAPMIIRGRPLNYTLKFSFYKATDMDIFLQLATRHHFQAGNTPDAHPQDTGHSDASDTLNEDDFYDEDEINFFHQFEMQLNWDIGN